MNAPEFLKEVVASESQYYLQYFWITTGTYYL